MTTVLVVTIAFAKTTSVCPVVSHTKMNAAIAAPAIAMRVQLAVGIS